MGLGRNILGRLARTAYVREALARPVELSALKRRPTKRVWFGIFLAALSYTIGWPVILFLGWLAYRLEQPLVIAIGGPVTYGISHLTFLAGAYFAGSGYVPTFLRWATRRFFERFAGAGRQAGHPAVVGEVGESGPRSVGG
ncbi:MAG: hypothetical protein HY905_13360 [Deltaproteobacteria bacterium]|nr:hypothetical protein [Deltaproteobacteria bacterium]